MTCYTLGFYNPTNSSSLSWIKEIIIILIQRDQRISWICRPELIHFGHWSEAFERNESFAKDPSLVKEELGR